MEILCKIRDIYRSIAEFETAFEKKYNLCLNEGMLLCSLSQTEKLSSGEIAHLLNLNTSHTSKLIKSVEEKGFIERILGEKDKRQMYFSLTDEGYKMLKAIQKNDIKPPEELKYLF